ncbi:VanZ family protein [Bacillus sp. JJ1532]|uniref:VanZ family protein n=1 Tax=unclassified Bacillus (in: firmicutes) TaxID=185979 RepID=UPI00300089CB
MKKKYIWLTAAIVYCIAIFITTASPASTGGNTLMIIADIFNLSEGQASMINVIFRKLVHLSAFGVLAILFYNSFEKHRFIQAWLYTTIYAASDEIHQAFLPDRTGAIVDVGIDSIGALIALSIIKMATLRRR